MNNRVCLSVIIHHQAALLIPLLNDLERYCKDQVKLIITVNMPETIDISQYSFPIRLIHNAKPRGFAENHNQAFQQADMEYFCIINPDVRLTANPFSALLELLRQDKHIGIAAPKVINSHGKIEDSARKFITLARLLKRVICRQRQPDYAIGNSIIKPDWVAGMFMLFRSATFKEIGGLDERYYLYCEDVDICLRMRCKGYEVGFVPAAVVVHDAQHSSHKRLRYLCWHLESMFKYFIRYYFHQNHALPGRSFAE